MSIYLDQGTPEEILPRMPSDWVVLDVGGWAKPLGRADIVVDIEPWETRRAANFERFSPETWYQIDFGGSQEYFLPFTDNEIDFVWCQQTLEDIADPFRLMREIQRIGKGGFIEVPNRQWESAKGVDSLDFCGFCHHRWFCELKADVFSFTMKSPFVMQYGAMDVPEKRNLGFIWANDFEFREDTPRTKETIIQDLIDFKNIRSKFQVGVY